MAEYLCLNCAVPFLESVKHGGHGREGIGYDAEPPAGTSCARCGEALPESEVRELDAAELAGFRQVAVISR